MRALLFLSIVGAAIYAFLVATHNVISDSKVEDTFAGQTQPNHPIDRKLRSWGSNLPALAISQQPSPRRPQQNARYGPRPTEENYGQYSERTAGAGDEPAASQGKSTASEVDQPIEWAKVLLVSEGAQRGLCLISYNPVLSRWYRGAGRQSRSGLVSVIGPGDPRAGLGI